MTALNQPVLLFNESPSGERSMTSILTQLMEERNVSQVDLSRATGVPASTLNRLFLGGTEDPRVSTVKQIAKYFDLTLGQIVGTEPLPSKGIGSSLKSQAGLHTIPILYWDEINDWMHLAENITPYTSDSWIVTEKQVGNHAFAIRSSATFSPWFDENSILIIDPDFKYSDGSFVVVALDGVTPTIRRIHKDGNIIFLKSIRSDLDQFKDNHRIYGTIIESRFVREIESRVRMKV